MKAIGMKPMLVVMALANDELIWALGVVAKEQRYPLEDAERPERRDQIEGRPSTRISVALERASGEADTDERQGTEEQEIPRLPCAIVYEAATTQSVTSAADRDVEAADEQRVRLTDRDERAAASLSAAGS